MHSTYPSRTISETQDFLDSISNSLLFSHSRNLYFYPPSSSHIGCRFLLAWNAQTSESDSTPHIIVEQVVWGPRTCDSCVLKSCFGNSTSTSWYDRVNRTDGDASLDASLDASWKFRVGHWVKPLARACRTFRNLIDLVVISLSTRIMIGI